MTEQKINVKHDCNMIDALVEDITKTMMFMEQEKKDILRDEIRALFYHFMMKQYSEQEIKYLLMRQNSPNYNMRG